MNKSSGNKQKNIKMITFNMRIQRQFLTREKLLLDCQLYVWRISSNLSISELNFGRSEHEVAQHWVIIIFTSCGQFLGQGSLLWSSNIFTSTNEFISECSGPFISLYLLGGLSWGSQRVNISYNVTAKDQTSDSNENLPSLKHSRAYQKTGLSPPSWIR